MSNESSPAVPLQVLRDVVEKLDEELTEPSKTLLHRLINHYDPHAPFPEKSPEETGFGPLDSDNFKEYNRDRRRWEAGQRPRFSP